MKSFFSGLLSAAIAGAVKTAAGAVDGGAGLKDTGGAGLAGGIAGSLLFVLSHPVGKHAAAQNAVVLAASPATVFVAPVPPAPAA